MRQRASAFFIGLTLCSTPALAQAPNWQQSLQGLLGGNQHDDDRLHEAYERGYRRGREDERAQLSRRPGPGYDTPDRPPPPSYDRQ